MLKILKRAGMLCKASAIALCRLLINLIDNMQSLFLHPLFIIIMNIWMSAKIEKF